VKRIEGQPAYILHYRSFRETSLILELFTRDHGRIAALAKGVKTKRVRNIGTLQPFVPLLIAASGRGELLTLKTFEAAKHPHFLAGKKLLSGFYLNELLMRLLPKWDPHVELFEAYQNTLEMLEAKDPQTEPLLRLFEKTLLKSMGYELQLAKDTPHGKAVIETEYYLYQPESGVSRVIDAPTAPTQIRAQNSKDQFFKGSSLMALHNGVLEEPEVLRDAKRLIRMALRVHLGDKPLASRDLWIA